MTNTLTRREAVARWRIERRRRITFRLMVAALALNLILAIAILTALIGNRP